MSMRGTGSKRAIPTPESIPPKTARPLRSAQIPNAIPLTDAGLLAIGIDPVVVKTVVAIRKHAAETPAAKPPTQRAGTKQAQIIALLERPEGATIAEIVEATAWQAHSARGLISGVLKKKLGLAVGSTKEDGRGAVYRIG
jgi:hypothetical protein